MAVAHVSTAFRLHICHNYLPGLPDCRTASGRASCKSAWEGCIYSPGTTLFSDQYKSLRHVEEKSDHCVTNERLC